MKNILLGIIAINLTFISANLALRSVGAVHAQATAQDLNDSVVDWDVPANVNVNDGEDTDEGEESGEAADLNLINANTTGAITLDGGEDSGEGEESDEGEDSLGELPDDADTDNLEITVSDDG